MSDRCTLCLGTQKLDVRYMNGQRYVGPCTGCRDGSRESQEQVSEELRRAAADTTRRMREGD